MTLDSIKPVKVVITSHALWVFLYIYVSIYLLVFMDTKAYWWDIKKTDKKFGLVWIVVIHQNYVKISRIRLDIKLRFSEIKIFDQLIWQFDRKDLLLQIKLFENVVFVEIFVGPISIKPIACVTSSLILGVGFESRLPFPV